MNKMNLKNLMLILVFGFGFALTGCDTDPCEDVTCQNNGIATEVGDDNCECDCAAGYEGDRCETETRSKFTGTYVVEDLCSASGSASYQVIVTNGAGVSDVMITNFWNEFVNSVKATIDGNKITVANQEPDNDDYFVEGNGTINGNKITMTYTVTDDEGNKDTCTSSWTK